MARGQLSRETFIALARKALIASGVENVKVDVMARRLKVTRGSFYWHFKNRQALLDALLDEWEANNRRELAIMEERVSEGAAGMMEMFHIWLGENPDFPAFDRAVRAWSLKSKRVAKVVGAIDDAWVKLFQAFFERIGMSSMESFARARVTYFHQIGYYAMTFKETLEERIPLMPYYYAALIGSPAPEGMEEELRRVALPNPSADKAGRAAKKTKPTTKTRTTAKTATKPATPRARKARSA